MLRASLLLVLVTGCQLVFELGSDEDGDGTLDIEDPCPHIANEDGADNDSDGIPNDCDLVVDGVFDEQTLFISFFDGNPLAGNGTVVTVPGGVELGTITSDRSVLDVGIEAANDALVEIGFEILEHETPIASGSVELGVYTVHRDFDDNLNRGDNCLIARESEATAGVLELNEDAKDLETAALVDDVRGLTGRFQVKREDRIDALFCQVAAGAAKAERTSRINEDNDLPLQGRIVITTQRMRVRIDYIWIAYREGPFTPP